MAKDWPKNAVNAFLQSTPYDRKIDPITDKVPVISMNLQPGPKSSVFH